MRCDAPQLQLEQRAAFASHEALAAALDETHRTTIALHTYAALEQKSRQNLKLLVKTLQDSLDGQGLPPLRGHSPDVTMDWILSVQCALCRAKGLDLEPSDFGAPAVAAEDGFFGRGEPMPKSKASGQPAAALQENVQANVSTQNAYEAACFGAQQARARNQGSNIFG